MKFIYIYIYICSIFLFFRNTGCISIFRWHTEPRHFWTYWFKKFLYSCLWILILLYTCGSSGGVNFRNTQKCVASFLINELSHRLDLISESKSIRTKWRTRLILIWTWGGSSVFHYQVFLHNPLCVKNMFCTKIQ